MIPKIQTFLGTLSCCVFNTRFTYFPTKCWLSQRSGRIQWLFNLRVTLGLVQGKSLSKHLIHKLKELNTKARLEFKFMDHRAEILLPYIMIQWMLRLCRSTKQPVTGRWEIQVPSCVPLPSSSCLLLPKQFRLCAFISSRPETRKLKGGCVSWLVKIRSGLMKGEENAVNRAWPSGCKYRISNLWLCE